MDNFELFDEPLMSSLGCKRKIKVGTFYGTLLKFTQVFLFNSQTRNVELSAFAKKNPTVLEF